MCEAAGYDVVIVETVGDRPVGGRRSRSMVDFFLVLLQPGAGDELQGMKQGVLELADALVVNKADGEQRRLAERTRGEHARRARAAAPALADLAPARAGRERAHRGGRSRRSGRWSSRTARPLRASGELEARRREQARAWMWSLVDEGLRRAFRAHPGGGAADRRRSSARSRRCGRRPRRAARALLEPSEKGR